MVLLTGDYNKVPVKPSCTDVRACVRAFGLLRGRQVF